MKIFFKFAEVVKSDTAKKLGIDNTVPSSLFDNLFRSFAGMQEVRKLLGKPCNVSSWYRCKALNDALKSSSKTSHHMECLAVDFSVGGGMSLDDAFNTIAKSNIEFDQLIIEKNSSGSRWIHISFHPNNRREVKSMTVK